VPRYLRKIVIYNELSRVVDNVMVVDDDVYVYVYINLVYVQIKVILSLITYINGRKYLNC